MTSFFADYFNDRTTNVIKKIRAIIVLESIQAAA